MILVDTSVWIDYFNGNKTTQTENLDHLLSEDSILMGDIILAELLQGFKRDRDFRKAKKELWLLKCVHLGGKSLALKAAMNFRFLRSKGITIRKTVDMLIGSWCIEHKIPLLHNDKDFDQMAQHLPLEIVSI